jgi:aryl-alcohol dehydrogenase-like predicted oxidoreductase
MRGPAVRYVKLSQNCGLFVSALSLGTWHLPRLPERDEAGAFKVDVDEFRRVLKRAYDLGINFFDTANRYHGGISPVPLTHVGYAERLLGRLIRELELHRESVVIATKVAGEMAPWPNGRGLSRKHVMWQIRESLARLGVDYVDIYYAHLHDPWTPAREVISTFNDLVRAGLVRYVGVSNIPPDVVVEMQMIAERYGYEPIAVLQYRYNLLDRSIEKTVIPVARRFGMGVTAYSPLAQGVLTGKYVDPAERRWVVPRGSRAEYVQSLAREMFTERNLRIVLEVVEIAREKGVSPAQLALSWILHRAEELGVSVVPIVGVSSVQQLEELVESVNVRLGSDDVKRLNEVSEPSPA